MLRESSRAALLICACIAGCTAAPLADTGGVGAVDLGTAVVLGVASLVCLVLAVVGCACCCDKTSLLKFEETVEYDEGHNANQSRNNDAFADFSPPTQSTPSFPPGTVSETVNIEPLPDLSSRLQTSSHGVPQLGTKVGEGGEQDELKHLKSPRFVFPRDHLNYVDELGNGWFGKVLQGEAHRLHAGMRKTRVIIKQLRDTASPEEQLLFLQEVQPYREVNHPNVLMLLGQCIETIPLLLVLEYAPYGDLKQYLRKSRGQAGEMAARDTQLRMAHDVISGLLWLHQADFIHIDFAARNCVVCADTSVKIGDYGLALEKYPEDYYMTKDGCRAVPIRWLAPEVIEVTSQDIKPKKITKQSNIWSFGVIMLELSTSAERPYSNLSDEEVLKRIVVDQEIKLDKPSLNVKYADRWFEIMMFCWTDHDTRPTVKEIHELLTHLKKNSDSIDTEDFQTRWNAIKPVAAVNQSSSECSEASQDAVQQEAASPTEPLASVAGQTVQPTGVVDGQSADTTEQVVSVDVTLPSFGDDKPEPGGQKEDPFVQLEDEDDFANIRAPSLEIVRDETKEPEDLASADDVIPRVAEPDAFASPAVHTEAQPGMFDDSFGVPSPIVSRPDDQQDRLADSLTASDVSSKTPEFFSSNEAGTAEMNPFASSQPPDFQASIDTSVSSGAYNTAMSSAIEADDSTATFTESFNTSSNHFMSSSEMGGFVSAVESTGDGSAARHDSNGFGDFEGSGFSPGSPSEGGFSSVQGTPTTIGQATPQGDDLLGDTPKASNPFSSEEATSSVSASLSFGADVDSPPSKDMPEGEQGSEVKDASLLSFGTITLKDHDDVSSPSLPAPTQHDLPHGFAAVSTAQKKSFGMTMLTVKSGSKKKSIEIIKDENEAGDKQAPNGEAVTVTTASAGGGDATETGDGLMAPAFLSDEAGPRLLDLDAVGVEETVGSVHSQGGAFGSIEIEVSKDGEGAAVVKTQSADSNGFGDFGDFMK